MFDLHEFTAQLGETWPVWVVTITLVVAAVIDGLKLKVPNWITFPMILSGWVYSAAFSPYAGLGRPVAEPDRHGRRAWRCCCRRMPWAAWAPATSSCWPASAPGCGARITLYAFAVSALVGGVIAVGMVVWAGAWQKHKNQFWSILNEIATVKDPEKLAEIAAERKPRMFLLPYGIPIAIGSIAYFACTGMLG